MTSVTCAMAWLCAVLMVPLMLFIWALDTKRTRINRYRSYGGAGKKLLMFMESAQQQLGGGAWLDISSNIVLFTLYRKFPEIYCCD